jgi:N,N'-diacetyllegionaminate synthase
MRTVSIGRKRIRPGAKTFIIAEAGVNHNGDISIALELVRAAKAAGADAIKFQSFQAAKLCGLNLTETKNVEAITGGTKSSYQMYKALELSDDDHRKLTRECKKNGIIFLSSVFDEERVDLLKKLGTAAFKISSGDITHLPLIKHAAGKGLPMLISTGMSTIGEVENAVRCCREAGNEDIVLFHCCCNYPADYKNINLNAMETMHKAFDVPVGYSDHSVDIFVPVAAVTMGASVIEKHFTLGNDMPGPDHALSLDPNNFSKMVQGIRAVEKAKGSFVKQPAPTEVNLVHDGRRSLVALKEIKPGQRITRSALTAIKPASGISPDHLDAIIGKRAKKTIKKSKPVRWNDLA